MSRPLSPRGRSSSVSYTHLDVYKRQAQSYPSRTKDTDDVDISTGSVGLGVAFTAFASMIQDYVRLKPWARKDWGEGRLIGLVGDAGLDEGNVYECLLEGWKHGLRNSWWAVSYTHLDVYKRQASGRPTNSPSSSKRRCATPRCATACQ